MEPVIGFIGIGAMGAPMSRNLLKAGFPLIIYDLREKAIEELAAKGAQKVSSPGDLAGRCSTVITSEALVLAAKMGLDPKKVIDVINSSTGQSWSSHFNFPTFVLNNAFNSGFTIALMNKDLDMATRLGREHYVPMFVGAAVQQLFNYAMSQGCGGECHTAIAKFIEDWGGVKVRSKQGG